MARELDAIKSVHSSLLKRAMPNPPTNEMERSQLIADAAQLINDIERCSAQAQTLDDYTWLSTAAVQWQTVFSSVLGIPRNINLAAPPRSIKLPEHKRVADDSEVDQWIQDTAYYFSKLRRAQDLLQEVGDILQKAEETPSFDAGEVAADWHRAEVSFASEVIDGRIHLNRLSADAYYRLETVWLKEVKELKAYFIWRRTRKQPEDNYYAACEQVRERLLSCPKGSAEEFRCTRTYIETRYLTDGVITPEVNSAIRKDVIDVKARRIWETSRGRNSPDENWANAHMYVKLFYENIIPAVMNKSLENTVSVLRAFGFSKEPGHRYLIINAFEAAIAIYFLDADVVREALARELVDWHMIL